MKYTFEEAFEKIKTIQSIEKAALSDHIIKLQEELGEISESYLLMTGYKLPKQSKEQEKMHLIEETVDSIIVSMAILAAAGASNNYVEFMLKNKIEKWEIALEKKQELANNEPTT